MGDASLEGAPKCAKTPLQGSVGILPAFLWFAPFENAPPMDRQSHASLKVAKTNDGSHVPWQTGRPERLRFSRPAVPTCPLPLRFAEPEAVYPACGLRPFQSVFGTSSSTEHATKVPLLQPLTFGFSPLE